MGTRWVTARDLPWFYIKSSVRSTRSVDLTDDRSYGGFNFGGGNYGLNTTHAFSNSSLQSFGGLQSGFESYNIGNTFSSYEGHLQSAISAPRSFKRKGNNTELQQSRSRGSTTDTELIQTSHITTLVNGETVDVDTVETDADYEFKYSAPICKITFTVQSKLKFINNDFRYSCDNELQKLFDEAIQIDQQDKYKEFIETQKKQEKNKDPNCYVCLESNPNVMFCCCGHIAGHEKCIQNEKMCGLCRTIITAKLTLGVCDP